MCAFANVVISVLFDVIVTCALDVRIETIEDDGTRDVWTFQSNSLKSQSHCLSFGLSFGFTCHPHSTHTMFYLVGLHAELACAFIRILLFFPVVGRSVCSLHT